jgi:hypothetical protein
MRKTVLQRTCGESWWPVGRLHRRTGPQLIRSYSACIRYPTLNFGHHSISISWAQIIQGMHSVLTYDICPPSLSLPWFYVACCITYEKAHDHSAHQLKGCEPAKSVKINHLKCVVRVAGTDNPVQELRYQTPHRYIPQ